MSVINRMLRDLDQRKRQPGASHQPAAIAPRSRWSLAHSFLLIGAVLVVGVAMYWLLNLDERAVESKPVAVARIAESDAGLDTDADPEPEPEPEPEQVSKPISKLPTESIAAASERTGTDETEAQQQPESDAKTATAANGEPATETNTPPIATPTNKAALVAATESPAKAETSSADTSNSEPSLSIKRVQLSPSALAQRNLEKAEEAFNKGDQREGQRLLEEALAVQPMNVAVRERLSAYWYGRGFGNRAIVLLNEGIQLAPQAEKLKLLLARIYQRLDMNNDAYNVLKGLTLTGSNDVVPLGQRAELAWKNQDYQLAIQDYQRLTQVQPEHARWWLGLALAHDDGDDVIAATAAYQQALEVGGLNVASHEYIEARLAQLMPLVEVN